MAMQQAYHAYVQHSKGTLMSGQTISVNKYTVQVERYLSQGGFAQVYLVRTQTPVYNTTHHVLKHIVVANEVALTEVKKEVDVMRLLRGHPNIVYLIDAAWAKMPNGAFEVYILMEYCPGGGIIDMMNRRLRERLTEAEILQIFVEVCEGLAHMHNSRPPLLHRDLKVENILQSSATSFKLCDFGSATTVTKPPANSQEIHALEADLNRHTTLQYRAPEMIDLHSRKPIDEKSDVWALGVLLYKLCYYTTPFEEHGPLAILNVQYKFPSYPVYSQQMMHLISSMLREHGPQRPTAFEVLAHVHGIRGTKSPYNHPLPAPTPLSFRSPDPKPNPLEGVITYRQPAPSHTPIKPQPMKPVELATPSERRGRPKPNSRGDASSSRSSTPIKSQTHHVTEKHKISDDDGFGADGNAAWSSVIAKNTSAVGQRGPTSDEAWNIPPISGHEKTAKIPAAAPGTGFNDDFTQKLWASTSSSMVKPLLPTPSPRLQSRSPQLVPLSGTALTPSGGPQRAKHETQLRGSKERDAFEGLGLMTPISRPAPTLGEARKLRTGLAAVSTNINKPIRPSPSPRLRPKATTPRVSPVPPLHLLEPESSGWSASKSTNDKEGFSAATRFPSLEELNATFPFPTGPPVKNTPSRQEVKPVHRALEPPSLPPRPSKIGTVGTGTETGARAGLLRPTTMGHTIDGTRSEQVTGFAMRDMKGDHPHKEPGENPTSQKREKSKYDNRDSPSPAKPEAFTSLRPILPNDNGNTLSLLTPASGVSESPSISHRPSPAIPSIDHSSRSKDWLTGDDEADISPQPSYETRLGNDVFKIRESPSKRASVIEQSDILEATIPQQGHAPTPPAYGSAKLASTTAVESPTISRFMKSFPAIDTTAISIPPSSALTDGWSPASTSESHFVTKNDKGRGELSSSGDEGPEEPVSLSSAPPKASSMRSKRKGRQSSVHDLVDLWGGGLTGTREKPLENSVPFKQDTGATRIKPTTLTSISRAASPPRKSPVTSAIQDHSALPSKTEQSSQPSAIIPSASPIPSRVRPQSLFIFPSRSIDGSSQPSASLLPPEEIKPRSGRRTSISDMVQHYEAMQASGRTSGAVAPSSPVNLVKSLPSTRDSVQDTISPRPGKPGLDKIAVALPGLGTPSTSHSSGDPIKRRTSLTVPTTHTPLNVRRLSPVEKPVDRTGSTSEVDSAPSRPRNTSIVRSEPAKLPPVIGRKPAISLEETTTQSQSDPIRPRASDDPPPSPERPYQGVGKLIDQWQRKTAEAEASRNAIMAKRTSLAPPKRAGLIPNSGKSS